MDNSPSLMSSSSLSPILSSKVYTATVSAPTNIAVIKYWGKADAFYNTPINSSISVTLDQSDLRAVTTVAASKAFTSDRLWLNGVEDVMAASSKRFRSCIDGVKSLASDKTFDENDTVTKSDWQTMKIHVSSYNTFPTAAGLASSAAGYAALVAGLAELMNAVETFEGELSTLARQGSGSACRSLYGGFVAWRMGSAANEWKDSKAEQIADENYWPEMRSLIMVVSDLKKDTSSTDGMSTSVATSLLLHHRASTVVPERMKLMEQAWLQRDFSTFAKLTMQDSNQFHATCLDTYPPIFYMNDVSRTIIRIVTLYNQYYCNRYGPDAIKVAYTFDAGPNAVMYLLEETLVEVGALMIHYFPPLLSSSMTSYIHNNPELVSKIQQYELNPNLIAACDQAGRKPQPSLDVKMVYVAKVGSGPQVLTGKIPSNIDPLTGLNTYTPEAVGSK